MYAKLRLVEDNKGNLTAANPNLFRTGTFRRQPGLYRASSDIPPSNSNSSLQPIGIFFLNLAKYFPPGIGIIVQGDTILSNNCS